jgi:hypothetical protein
MHIDRANQVTVSHKTADPARPISVPGLVTMPASGTLAAGSSFGAGEARDAGLLRFVGDVINVLAVFPQGHALVMVSSGVPIAHAVRVADEERSHIVLDAEVDDQPCGLVTQLTGRFDRPKKSTEDGLHRLTMQGELAFGEMMQIVVFGPGSMNEPGGFVRLHAQVPYRCRFHLRCLEPLEERWG